MSLKVFPDETSIWISGLSRVDCSPQRRWASSSPLKVWIEQSVEERNMCPLFPYLTAWAGTPHLIFSGPQTAIYTISFPGSQNFLWILTKLHHWLSWVSRLQTIDYGTSQSPSLCEPILIDRHWYREIYKHIDKTRTQWGKEEVGWTEISNDIYILLCLKQIAGRKQLHNTGSLVWCCVMTWETGGGGGWGGRVWRQEGPSFQRWEGGLRVTPAVSVNSKDIHSLGGGSSSRRR